MLYNISDTIFILEFLFIYSCSPPHITGDADEDDVLESINDYFTKELPSGSRIFCCWKKDICEDLAEKINTAVRIRLSQV